jgi:L-fuconolactonase
MRVIDAHQHFWHYDPVRDNWITSEMSVIRRNFLPDDLWPVLQQNQIECCVAVQAEQSEAETLFLLDLADNYSFIGGVVGWVDLRAENLPERLTHFSGFKKLKGFRHILQSESDRALMLDPAFQRGIGALVQYGFTYDLLILPDQLAYATELVKAYPQQKFVLDHIAKPPVKNGDIADWEDGIRRLALQPNVRCKVSGLVTEADWMAWKPEDFTRYLDVIFESFGTDRIMFGSDWPVCLLAAEYQQVKQIMTSYMGNLSPHDQEKIWSGNAIQFYQLT